MDVVYYKGSLYPLPLDDNENLNAGEVPVKNLVDICAEKIVQDSTTTSRALDAVPRDLCYNLMKAALLNTRDRSIEVLISRWPWRVISLKKLAPPLFDSIKALYDDEYIKVQMRKGVKCTTCLAHTFVECLKKRSPTQLKYLDMTGFPAAEVIMDYLSSHVLLVSNEARQKQIITMYNEVTADLPVDQRRVYNIDTTLPDESFAICLDAYIQNPESHMEFCRALETSKTDVCGFRLQVNSLDLSNLGVARICVLLEQVNPVKMTQLCIQYNSISNNGLSVLAPAVQRLTSLTCLDMSCNNIVINSSRDDIAVLMGEMIGALPLLQRLNLSNNRLKQKLYRVLGNLQQPLQYLNLCGCGLSQQDLLFLARSQHSTHLQELDLSENSIGSGLPSLMTLIQAISGNIRTLEMEGCSFFQADLVNLMSVLPRCSQLLYLNLARNTELVKDVVEQIMNCLASLRSFKAWKVSFPVEVYYASADYDSLKEEQTSFENRLASSLNVLCKGNNRENIQVHLVEMLKAVENSML